MEFIRTKKVMSELISLGESITYNGAAFTDEEMHNIDFEKAKEALAETKERIGNQRMIELYKDYIEKSNEMCRQIAEKSPAMENLQPCIVAAEVRSITVQNLMDFMKTVYEESRLSMFSKLNPEYYFLKIIQAVRLS